MATVTKYVKAAKAWYNAGIPMAKLQEKYNGINLPKTKARKLRKIMRAKRVIAQKRINSIYRQLSVRQKAEARRMHGKLEARLKRMKTRVKL